MAATTVEVLFKFSEIGEDIGTKIYKRLNTVNKNIRALNPGKEYYQKMSENSEILSKSIQSVAGSLERVVGYFDSVSDAISNIFGQSEGYAKSIQQRSETFQSRWIGLSAIIGKSI